MCTQDKNTTALEKSEVNQTSKRPITDKEFEEFKNSIRRMFPAENVPTLKKEWMP